MDQKNAGFDFLRRRRVLAYRRTKKYMLKLILALLPVAANLTALQMGTIAGTATVAKTSTKAGPPSSSSSIQGIPAGAVKIDENTFRYQEKDASGKPGKIWLFRRNPFGVSKVVESEAAKIGLVRPAKDTPATATDLGDSYRFERAGPFGAKIWTKKKSELTPEEQAIVDQGKAAPVSTQKAAN